MSAYEDESLKEEMERLPGMTLGTVGRARDLEVRNNFMGLLAKMDTGEPVTLVLAQQGVTEHKLQAEMVRIEVLFHEYAGIFHELGFDGDKCVRAAIEMSKAKSQPPRGYAIAKRFLNSVQVWLMDPTTDGAVKDGYRRPFTIAT